MQKILVIAAHPDDEILGVGGTMARYVAQGDEVAVMIVTDGSTSQYRQNENIDAILAEKKNETEVACTIVGVKKIFYGELPDMKLDVISHIDINEKIEKVLEEFKPEIVFTHFWGDVNKDHKMVYESTLVACRPVMNQIVKKIYAYSVPSSTEWNFGNVSNTFSPNTFIDIDGEYSEKKYLAMNAYKKELRPYPHPRSIEFLKKSDMVEGNKVGLKCAESFILLREVN